MHRRTRIIRLTCKLNQEYNVENINVSFAVLFSVTPSNLGHVHVLPLGQKCSLLMAMDT